jgi:hypothetical protein
MHSSRGLARAAATPASPCRPISVSCANVKNASPEASLSLSIYHALTWYCAVMRSHGIAGLRNWRQRASLPAASQRAGFDDLTRYLLPSTPGSNPDTFRRVTLRCCSSSPAPRLAAPPLHSTASRSDVVEADTQSDVLHFPRHTLYTQPDAADGAGFCCVLGHQGG